MTLTLTLRNEPRVPLEAELISPDTLSGMTTEEIRAVTLIHGKRRLRLDDFFDVEGEPSADLVLKGPMSKVRWVGREMKTGSVTIHGDIGMHLGSRMRGGRITVHGNAGDWVGAEMRNGVIRIHGDAGGQIGAAYRGAMGGMRNGLITVDGNAGLEVGMRMRRGTISIGGTARDFTGLQMKGGTIILKSGAELRTGAWMNRGTIIAMKPVQLMPTFRFSTHGTPGFLTVLERYLADAGTDADLSSRRYAVYAGDFSVPGKGELLIAEPTA